MGKLEPFVITVAIPGARETYPHVIGMMTATSPADAIERFTIRVPPLIREQGLRLEAVANRVLKIEPAFRTWRPITGGFAYDQALIEDKVRRWMSEAGQEVRGR